MRRRALPGLALACTLAATTAMAAEFRATSEAAVLYDAPSVKGKPLFVLGRDYPLEVIVTLESWLKVRDAGGTVAWVERKALAERRTLVVRTPVAEVLANADASAPMVFKAEQNVLLELVDQGQAVATPGWVKVRHRDGQTGFVRIGQVWGL
jgi:SH3-like domain-containing protein